MLNVLKRWYNRGRLLLDPTRLHLETITSYYTQELTEPGFRPVYHEGEPLEVPRRVKHDNSDAHNRLDESIKFMLRGVKRLKDDAQDCYWDDLKAIITESGAPVELFQLVESLQAYCQGLRAVAAYKQASVGVYYWTVPVDAPDPNPYPFRGSLSAETIRRTGILHDTTTIILTYRGVPIHQIPEIRDYWEAMFSKGFDDVVMVTDVITGEKGVSSRLFAPVSMGGYEAPLASFNQKTWQFDQEKQLRSLPLTVPTTLTINEGFESMLPRQTMRLDKLGVDDLAISWHVEGVLEHPILPILSSVINGGNVEETKATWEALKQLPDDPSIVHFAAWVAVRGRFGLVDDWTVTVSRLRDNLLQYDSEWASFGHHPVRRILLRNIDPQPYTLSVRHHVPVFRAITLGTTLSDTLASDQALNGVHRDARGSSQWTLVYLSRKYGINMAQHPADIILREYKKDEPIPRLSEYVGDFEKKLADQPDNLAAFRYGQLLAFHDKLGSNYRVIKGHKFSGTPVFKRVRTLKEYFTKEIQQFAFWRHLLDERLGVSTKVTLLFYDDLIRRLDPTMQINTNNVYVNAGWARARAYIDETVRYYQIMQQYVAPGEDPQDLPGHPTPEELQQAS